MDTACFTSPSLLPLLLGSDLILTVAFLAIATAIVLYTQRKRPEFSSTAYMIAGFVGWLGLVYGLSVINYLYPMPYVLGGAKALTGLALVIFAISLYPLLPAMVQMITPGEYDTMLQEVMQANQRLKKDLADAESSLKTLESELTNRVRHILATVHGFAKETARSSTDIKSYLKKFNARLGALSSTNNLLLANQWKGATMKAVVYSQLELYSALGLDRAQVTGPDVYLTPGAVEHLSMAFHELAANSADHRIKDANGNQPTVISWMQHRDERSQSNDTLRLSWMEPIDGMSNLSPIHKGFGHVVLNFVVPTALNGLSELRFQDQGVIWELEAPVTSLYA